ncbi:uncharacterized protein MAM_00350 [Metarhizium album ARSEF 1941]|uniref:Ankyrin repeat protein n=1 Tax=Metarhizium album (strain ARSEF 1941) TaxID=1081103 RepID=A0A0B2X4R8_METAS|nr:uncharacterized protein MAM_00350 [Metarhizium album ARSEF 1941]KHO01349.1 hypothetical protein MAM_00350 [Metarhizium album ARSEF 1941]
MAHNVPNLLLARLRRMPMISQPHEAPEPRPSDKSDADDGTYHPNPIDIVVVRIMLTRSVKLPPDLVDIIFDHAEYWAHSTNVIDYQADQQEPLRICGSSRAENRSRLAQLRSYPVGLTGIEGQDTLSEELAYDTQEARPLPRGTDCDTKYFAKLARYPTPRLMKPVRKVVFKIKSHDQGWTSGDNAHKGTYKASWTWFEAGLEKFDAAHTCDATDVRQETPESGSSALPVSGLRAVYPNVEQLPKSDDDGSREPEDGNGSQPEVEYKYVHPLLAQPEWEIQRNLMATSDWQEHMVTWSYLDDIEADSDAGKALEDQGRGRATGDGSFVRSLVLGDVVTVWGKARFGGWVNTVDHVKIEVYWAV